MFEKSVLITTDLDTLRAMRLAHMISRSAVGVRFDAAMAALTEKYSDELWDEVHTLSDQRRALTARMEEIGQAICAAQLALAT